KEVESGAQTNESLIWESRATPRLFGRDVVAGLVNVDLTPEVVVRLATALGTALPRGARVVASRESPPACRMTKRALISGFTSTGLDVGDLRVLPAAVARHLLKSEGYDAGVHIGTSQVDPEVVQIRFFEPPGIEASSAHGFTTDRSDSAFQMIREAMGQVKQLVPAVRADLGVVFDRAAERLYLTDEDGHEIPVEQTLLLFLRLLGSNGRRG